MKEKIEKIVDEPFGKTVACALSMIPAVAYALVCLCCPFESDIASNLWLLFWTVGIGIAHDCIRQWLTKKWKNGGFGSQLLLFIPMLVAAVAISIYFWVCGLQTAGITVFAAVVGRFFWLDGPSGEVKEILRSIRRRISR